MSLRCRNTCSQTAAALAVAALGASYPVMAHLSALTGRKDLVACSIGLLAVLVLLPGLRRGRWPAWAALALATLVLPAAVRSGHGMALLFLPPVLINGFVAWLFGHTLLEGRTPLIERVVHAMHGPGDTTVTADMLSYARQVTLFWTVLMSALTVINLLLAAFASPGGLLRIAGFDPAVAVPLEIWSLFANVLNYLVVGAAFAVEYAVRTRRFPRQPYTGFIDFTRKLMAHEELFRAASRRGKVR
jgi:uncharacterized membrane protein